MAQPDKLPLPFYLALAGPTASGKTAAALEIARHWDVEIISVDSALVYRGMDIGTAKPSAAEQATVVHHLIDIRDPLQAYSAAEFVRDATALIHAITSRCKLPLPVRASMLSSKALAAGPDATLPADAAVRALLSQEAADKGWPAMHALLAEVDPVTARRLAPNDSQRVQRALEVYRMTGLPLSHFHAARAQDAVAPASNSLLISLEPSERAWLHTRIAQRLDAMWAAGFLDEVKGLRARGDLHIDLPSMRCVGYRQAWESLDGLWPMAELRDKAVFATRQLAKRQITWLRSMPHRQLVACDAAEPLGQVLSLVQGAMQARAPG
ncbi:MAG: tRNA (adenosine(37)-N6)-dimethylallyltransferase MiaA [Rhodoferax sp.]|nr:tRNA (adenosine(37)-N6)-dimethylallyltransferase MiaA [Rhodoferax sp.]